MGKYHKIAEMLEDEIMKIPAKGELTTSGLEVGDKAAHFLKSIKTIEAMDDAEENGYSYDDGMGGRNSYNYGRMPMMGYDNRSYDSGMDRNSTARGRGSNARRDSMGRYSSRGYSRDDKMSKSEMMEQIEDFKRKLENMED